MKVVNKFKKCCAREIKRIWSDPEHGGPMNIVRYEGKCPKCGHYIGLTQTSEEEAKEFLSKYKLDYNN